MSPLISGLASVASLVFNAVSSGSNKSSASASSSRSAGAGDAGGPAAVLSLSPEAASLAGLADKGLVATQGKGSQALGTITDAVGRTAQGAALTKKDFQELLSQFGATDVQSEALAARFDVNNDGRISRDEFAKGLGQTRGAQSTTDFAQALMGLMDKAGDTDGKVSKQEFAALAAAFADASIQRPAGARTA
ncbi:EF-hand domain-containing protein [Paracidovorax sp. MALMAid1276]|uniref:EF-hand domain-containing protein n=1 Tax=Paracidovorax sp. MALMAid1276 TaxID=3411631 RepID=UPI003B991BC8